MRTIVRSTIIALGALLAGALTPATAAACGGFFCDQAQPVNQAAEGIIFAQNDDGTVTAVIQIKYQGPSKNFSWLLPISSVPKSDADIGVASDVAFQRLQAATNPNYALTTKVEGTCEQEDDGPLGAGGLAAVSGEGGEGGGATTGGVTVEASGVVGAFEWTVISLDKSLSNPADVAVSWLGDNGYDVPSSAPKLLGSYLQQGLYLLALRLTKGASVGSIRPIIINYQGSEPSIPVKLTAVAANDDMGVLTYVLGKSRAIPQNYNSVVIDAANDAGGQGFVTEFSGASSALKSQIWTNFDEYNWNHYATTPLTTAQFFNGVAQTFGSYDGFWDATRAAVTLPSGVTFEQLQACPSCYMNTVSFTQADYVAALDKNVFQPIQRVQSLITAHPQLTRMYTTLSADEMTLDPLFDFNADLPAVSNVHSAVRVIECNPNVTFSQAPWRIELPQGGVLRGSGAPASAWPAELAKLPPNRLIVRAGQSGPGRVVEDNSDQIKEALAAYNAGLPMPNAEGGSGGVPDSVAEGGVANTAGTSNGEGGDRSTPGSGANSPSGGCNLAGGGDPASAFVAASALALALLRRRKRR
jgi:MYXO-CTERM domain-containing protein